MRTLMLLFFLITTPVLSAQASISDLTDALKVGSSDRALELLDAKSQPKSVRDALTETVSAIHEQRKTRLGKLFFAMLSDFPQIQNIPEGATEIRATVVTPLALDAKIRIAVTWKHSDNSWKISAFRAQLEGASASKWSALAPYFATGKGDANALDNPEIDILLGRDDRKEFDFDSALTTYIDSESDAFETTRTTVLKSLDANKPPEELLKSAARHSLGKGKPDAKINDVKARLKELGTIARPDRLSKREGATVDLRVTGTENDKLFTHVTRAKRDDAVKIGGDTGE